MTWSVDSVFTACPAGTWYPRLRSFELLGLNIQYGNWSFSPSCYPTFVSTLDTLGAILQKPVHFQTRLWDVGRNPSSHLKNVRTPLRQHPRSGSNRGLLHYVTAALPAAPLCYPKIWNRRLQYVTGFHYLVYLSHPESSASLLRVLIYFETTGYWSLIFEAAEVVTRSWV